MGSENGGVLPFFPFVAPGSVYFGYGFFSLPHLVDLLNLVLLVSPFCIPLCLIPILKRRSLDRLDRFLVLASVFPLAGLVLFNPELGFPRDWDVFAYSLLVPTLFGIRWLIRICGNTRELLSYAGTAVIGLGLLHTVPWVLIQADEGRPLRRHEHLLAQGTAHSPHARAFGHEEIAIHYREHNLLDQAAKHYEKAIEATPFTSRLYHNLGDTYYQMNQLDSAIGIMKTGINLCPGAYRLHLNLATYYKKKGEITEAVNHLNQIIKIKPDYYVGWYNLGNIYYDTGKYEEAAGYYLKALELKPDDPSAHLNLGSTYARLRLYDKALSEYKNVLELDPDNRMAIKNLKAFQRLLNSTAPQ